MKDLPAYDRRTGFHGARITRLGSGEIGGKAHGLVKAQEIIDGLKPDQRFEDVTITIPRMVVLTTELFDHFMDRNRLWEACQKETLDTRLADLFQRAEFPTEYVGDIMSLAQEFRSPVAVRSSSLLEDALYRPFAGVYGTKMVPNNQYEPAERFRRLIEAIKFVYASTFFREARSYIAHFAEVDMQEKMSVILQEVIGRRYGDRFYPEVSGVARSFNYYAMNWVKPEDGIVDLALGLGKTIVDGDASWTYSPRLPHVNPPFNSIADLLKHTQLSFWAVNMGAPPAYDPVNEAEYLVRAGLDDAEVDGSLRFTASTYDIQSGRITSGISNPGPRLLNFAAILRFNRVPLNDLIVLLLNECEHHLGGPVEIEFAASIDPQDGLPATLGFLQVRPIVVDSAEIFLPDEAIEADDVMAASDNALGNGIVDKIEDVLLVRPDQFEWKNTTRIASELEELNARLVRQQRTCILIGYGRWGTTDEWRGIPVHVGQISAARVILEATLPGMVVAPSQGSHFFHNITSFRVFYFSMPHEEALRPIDWQGLDRLEVVDETEHVRWLRAKQPFKVIVDGKSRRGVIKYG